jgi:hypothetical protein
VAHIGQANIASFATPQPGGSPPYRFLFHAQRSEGSGSRVLVSVHSVCQFPEYVDMWGPSITNINPSIISGFFPVFLQCSSAAHMFALYPIPFQVQLTVSKSSTPSAAAVVRSDDAAAAAHVVDLMQTLLISL